jgi:hypothetical protein
MTLSGKPIGITSCHIFVSSLVDGIESSPSVSHGPGKVSNVKGSFRGFQFFPNNVCNVLLEEHVGRNSWTNLSLT